MITLLLLCGVVVVSTVEPFVTATSFVIREGWLVGLVEGMIHLGSTWLVGILATAFLLRAAHAGFPDRVSETDTHDLRIGLLWPVTFPLIAWMYWNALRAIRERPTPTE